MLGSETTCEVGQQLPGVLTLRARYACCVVFLTEGRIDWGSCSVTFLSFCTWQPLDQGSLAPTARTVLARALEPSSTARMV
jgi:hypothetical protein